MIFCARENVSNVTAAGPKIVEIRYVLSELDGFAVVLINRNRAFDFSPELLVTLLLLAHASDLTDQVLLHVS